MVAGMDTLEDETLTASWDLVPALATAPQCFVILAKVSVPEEIGKAARIVCHGAAISRLRCTAAEITAARTSSWGFWHGSFPLAATKS